MSDLSPPTPTKRRSRLRSFFNGRIGRGPGIELELLLLALATAIVDASTFTDYHVFVSNQTGNTVLLAVGSLRIASDFVDLRDVGVALGCFILGGFVFGQIGNVVGKNKRWWLIVSNVIQTALVLVATCLRHWVARESKGAGAMGVIAMLAVAAGAQVAMAKSVQVPEVPTAIITSAYIDLLSDKNLFKRSNHARDLRAAFLLSMLVGAYIGAGGYAKLGAALPMLLATIIKFGVCVALCFNHASRPETNP